MFTFFVTLVLMFALVFLGLAAQWWFFQNSAEKHDPERELYQQLLKSTRARPRSDDKYDPEWELYQQRYD